MAQSNTQRQAKFRAQSKARKAYVDQLEFFCAILLAVSTHRAESLAVMEDFIRTLKAAEDGTIRVCPERDMECPWGMRCPYAIDRYSCKPGFRERPHVS